MMHRLTFALAAALLLFSACSTTEPDTPVEKEKEAEVPEEKKESKEKEWEYGIPYMFDREVIPEIHIDVPLYEWNKLLAAYDENQETKKYVHCNVRYVARGETLVINDAGLRIRGNGSRRRPEGSERQTHVTDKGKWQHFHIGLNFRKFVKDDEHTVHGARKANLKFAFNDKNYVRELYSYDLFKRVGVWSVSNAVQCRVWIHVGEDRKEAYYGVYTMYEPVDEPFLKYRKKQFGSAKGNLWKCRQGAYLNKTSGDFGPDEDGDIEHIYELKTNTDEFDDALIQLKDFISNLNKLNGKDFHDWIASVCDVGYLLKTYAVNVGLGQWDDYWANGNNFYLYFNSTDYKDYKVFFIPCDYDNALGTSKEKGELKDAGTHDPLHWGQDRSPLIKKILEFDDYAEMYKKALLELTYPENELLYYESSIKRIKDWNDRIRDFVANDTGQETKIEDTPVSWSTTMHYRLLDPADEVNFFKIKCASIAKYCN